MPPGGPTDPTDEAPTASASTIKLVFFAEGAFEASFVARNTREADAYEAGLAAATGAFASTGRWRLYQLPRDLAILQGDQPPGEVAKALA